MDFDRVKDFKVLLVGDGIMDEYIYVSVVGKAVKEAALSSIAGKREVFRGGAWAAAEHLKTLCASVDVSTSPLTTWNTRYVEDTYLRKLFVVHEHREGEKNPSYPVRDYDVVIVTDFGHGTVTDELVALLTKEARFLAVNAQTNSTNYGFNMITRYPRADFVVIDELEARLAAHDRHSPIEDVILELGFKKIIVTQGTKGAIGFDGAFERQDALTDKVVDTMGAGDAFLAVTSPFAAAGFSMKDLLRIGNAAGAIKVGIVGHRKSVDRASLEACLG